MSVRFLILLCYYWYQCMPTMSDCQPDFFFYVHFSVIISILFSLDIQINILKMSTCLVVLNENYKRDFDWFGGQVVEARCGGMGKLVHSQVEGETQRDKIKQLGHPLILNFGGFSVFPGLCFRHTLIQHLFA